MKKQWLVLTVWFVTISVPLSYMMGFHTLAFANVQLRNLNSAPEIAKTQNWKMLHILSSECGCSKRASRYLLERKPLNNVDEYILVIGNSFKRQDELKSAGYKIIPVSSEEAFARFGIESVPQLVILDSNHFVRYSGGYNDSRVDVYEDLNLLTKLKDNKLVTAYPIFGCAVGSSVAKQIDPWGIKYGGQE